MTIRARVLSMALLLLCAIGIASAAPAYNRYPDLHDDRVVFCAEGDLWMVSAAGGTARRLTTHPGTEYFPHFSPDGTLIAFTGEYDGNRDVYVIPSEGGEPRRLTWHPASEEVLGWTPDGKSIVFRSGAESAHGSEIFTIAKDGGDPQKLPVGWASRLAIDPVSGQWAFNRKSWENATWKRYRGGTAPDIWIGHPDRKDFKLVTSFPGINAFPMWHGGRLWFVSDKGGTANLWSMKPDGSDLTRHTEFNEWDVRWPSIAPDGRIVFTLGADVYVFDPKDGRSKKLDVDVPSERSLTRTRYADPARTLTWYALSPKADRVAVVTRGEIFSVAVKDGVTLPVLRTSGARESWASFSPDGKRLVYVTDDTREESIRSIDAWGRGEPKTIKAAGESGWHFPPAWSPDGSRVAFSDQTQSLYVVPAEGGTPVLVDRSPQSEIRDYVWSPDGRWLAYAKAAPTDYQSIWLYDTKNAKTRRLTGAYTNDYAPAWDPDGRYLYFLSDRATNPVLDTRDLQNVEIKNTVAMMFLLRKDVKNPFINANGLPDAEEKDEKKDEAATKDDAGKKDESKKDESKKDEKKKDEKPKPVEIDLDGLERRFVRLPGIEVGRWARLGATSKLLFVLEVPLTGMTEQPGLGQQGQPQNTLHVYDLDKRKLKQFMDGVDSFEVAKKADKLAVMKKRGEIYVVDAAAAPPGELGESKVALDNVVLEIEPRAEWAQIYYEAWRHMRDFFWDPAMGGVNWKAVRDQYATLLPRLGTRDDVRDLVGETIGELNNSHTYVFGGDPGQRPPRISTGLLGARVTRDGDAYRVARIYRGDPADQVRSPLDEPGVAVAEGQYILAVNHHPFPKDKPFTAAFENLADKDVVLTVNAKPDAAGARDVVAHTLGDESDLLYADWVRQKREFVEQKTGGKVGYMHLPNMGAEGMTQFNTWFYPQLDKEALIVDNRWNGGGFVSQMVVERLRRKILTFDRARGGGVNSYPYRTLNGPFVVLTNEFAGSDGDIFPAAVQLEKLAPVIGMRSWGGVVGIRGDKLLIDGGMVTEPEFAWWDPKNGWTIENEGVKPDIEVQNLPQDVAADKDAQLERGLAEVLKLREAHPPIVPKWGPVRERTRDAFKKELEGSKAPAH